jgi:hypothetical protein
VLERRSSASSPSGLSVRGGGTKACIDQLDETVPRRGTTVQLQAVKPHTRHVCVPGYGEPGSSALNGSTTEAGLRSCQTLGSQACDMLAESRHHLHLLRTVVSGGLG